MVSIKIVRGFFVAAVLLTILWAAAMWQSRPIDWSPERQVTSGGGDSRLVDVKTDGLGGVHLVWEDDRSGSMEVFYKRSLDDGVTWDEDVKLTHMTPQTIEPMPRVVTSGSVVIVLFSNRTGSGEHIFYLVSRDQGIVFSSALQLSEDEGDQTYPAAASASGMIHVVWQAYLSGRARIAYVRSSDGGATWQSEVSLSNPDALDRHPAIFAIDRKVFVVWSRTIEGQDAVFSRASYDSGLTWQPEVQVSDFGAPVFLFFPSVSSNGTAVHVVWNWKEVYYARSSDSGATWDPPIPITFSVRNHLAPEVAVDGSHVEVVSAAILTEGSPRRMIISADVQYLQSTDGGNQWTDPFPLTEHGPALLSLAPAIWTQSGATFIAWQDDRNGSFAIYLKSKPDFAVVHAYQNQLLTPALLIFAVAAVTYSILEVKHARRPRRRRRAPPRRAVRRAKKGKKARS